MTELTDLNDTDSSNTAVTGSSTVGSIANMGGTDDLFQRILGMLSRFRNDGIFQLRNSSDNTKQLDFDLSGIATGSEVTLAAPNYSGVLGVRAQGAAIASATTTNLATATGDFVHITGTTPITGFGTAPAGVVRSVVFQGVLTLTHNAISLILPTSANIVTAANDSAIFVSEGAGNWRCLSYARASGSPIIFSNNDALPGSVVQTTAATYAANTDITALIPFDDTIPQSTEGVSIVVAAITPRSDTNRIRVTFTGEGTLDTVGALIVSLIRAGTANAVGASYTFVPTANYGVQVVATAEFVAGTTSSLSIEARAGVTSGTARFNGTTATRLFGGAMAATLRIEEMKA